MNNDLQNQQYFSQVVPGEPKTELEKEIHNMLQDFGRLTFNRDNAAQFVCFCDDMSTIINEKNESSIPLDFKAVVDKETGSIHLSFSENVKFILLAMRDVTFNTPIAIVEDLKGRQL